MNARAKIIALLVLSCGAYELSQLSGEKQNSEKKKVKSCEEISGADNTNKENLNSKP